MVAPFSYPVCGQNIIDNNCSILLSHLLLLVYGTSARFRTMASPISFLQSYLLLAAAMQDPCAANLWPIVISFCYPFPCPKLLPNLSKIIQILRGEDLNLTSNP